MDSVAAGVALCVIAFAIHYFGIGPDWLAWRVSMVLALGGLGSALAPVADRLRGWVTDGLGVVADAVQQAAGNDSYRDAIVTWTPRLAALLALVLWIGALLRGSWASKAGRIASAEPGQKHVWLYGVALVLFGTLVGGLASDAITWLGATTADLGGNAVTYLVGGA